MAGAPDQPLLVVLDLDETLIHSSSKALPRRCDFQLGEIFFYIRPGAQAFVRKLMSDPRFAVAVWTSAGFDYAMAVIEGLGVNAKDLQAVYSFTQCVKAQPLSDSEFWTGSYALIKDLTKLSRGTGWPLERMIAIDDTPSYYKRQYSNVLPVRRYEGLVEGQPGVFDALLDRLGALSEMDNVRPIEKRGWFFRHAKHKSAPQAGLEP